MSAKAEEKALLPTTNLALPGSNANAIANATITWISPKHQPPQTWNKANVTTDQTQATITEETPPTTLQQTMRRNRNQNSRNRKASPVILGTLVSLIGLASIIIGSYIGGKMAGIDVSPSYAYGIVSGIIAIIMSGFSIAGGKYGKRQWAVIATIITGFLSVIIGALAGIAAKNAIDSKDCLGPECKEGNKAKDCASKCFEEYETCYTGLCATSGTISVISLVILINTFYLLCMQCFCKDSLPDEARSASSSTRAFVPVAHNVNVVSPSVSQQSSRSDQMQTTVE